jgi:hypothetical protein
VRQDQVQAFGRLATDRKHVVAYTHDATFSACFEPIHLINQHDQLSYFHFFGGESFGFACELFARRNGYLMRSGFSRWMVLGLVQVESDDQEGRAPEKDSPVADIQTANGPNSKGNRASNHGRPLESAWPCLTALRTAWPSCLPPCTAAAPAPLPMLAANPAPAKKEVQP